MHSVVEALRDAFGQIAGGRRGRLGAMYLSLSLNLTKVLLDAGLFPCDGLRRRRRGADVAEEIASDIT